MGRCGLRRPGIREGSILVGMALANRMRSFPSLRSFQSPTNQFFNERDEFANAVLIRWPIAIKRAIQRRADEFRFLIVRELGRGVSAHGFRLLTSSRTARARSASDAFGSRQRQHSTRSFMLAAPHVPQHHSSTRGGVGASSLIASQRFSRGLGWQRCRRIGDRLPSQVPRAGAGVPVVPRKVI